MCICQKRLLFYFVPTVGLMTVIVNEKNPLLAVKEDCKKPFSSSANNCARNLERLTTVNHLEQHCQYHAKSVVLFRQLGINSSYELNRMKSTVRIEVAIKQSQFYKLLTRYFLINVVMIACNLHHY